MAWGVLPEQQQIGCLHTQTSFMQICLKKTFNICLQVNISMTKKKMQNGGATSRRHWPLGLGNQSKINQKNDRMLYRFLIEFCSYLVPNWPPTWGNQRLLCWFMLALGAILEPRCPRDPLRRPPGAILDRFWLILGRFGTNFRRFGTDF